MNIQEAILRRRSIYQKDFNQEEIGKDTIQELLECANAAPTHKRTQPWRFVVFRGEGREKLANEIGRLYETHTDPEKFLEKSKEAMRDKVLNSTVVIAICVQYSGAVPAWEEVAATAASVQNIWLAASAKGIGGYWGSPGLIIKHIGEFLDLKSNEECLGFFYMGRHTNEAREPVREPVSEKVTWIENLK